MGAIVVVVAVLGVAGPASSASTTTAAAAPPTIDWGACTDPTLQQAGAVCGLLSVPLDYAHPTGTRIQLAVSMVRHTTPDSQYQGIMLVNPGGPGGSGLVYSFLGQFVPNNAGDAYDWIGFDPRGVGASAPSLTCDPDYFGPDRPDYQPSTPALLDTWLSRTASYAAACKAQGAALLPHMSTLDSARDMDSIRAALGQPQLNYYGFSYGTYLGQVYATLFPQRVRRMVLDSSVDPHEVWYQLGLQEDVAFETNIKLWFGWVAKYDSVYHLGSTEQAVEQLWYRERDALRGAPAGGVVGPDEFSDLFQIPGYDQSFWPSLADAFAGWVHNADAETLIGWYQAFDNPGDDNAFAVFNAVTCTDAPAPGNWSTWQADADRVSAVAPFFTWPSLWYSAPCLYWPAPPGRPTTVDGSRVAPALLVDEELDALTPFEDSLEVRRLFPRSVLLAEPGGTTHAGTLVGNACVDDTIAGYLATGALPPREPGDGPDALCDPLPQPLPDAAAPHTAAPGVAAPRVAGTLTEPNGRPLLLPRGE
ncbi:MAG: alpha/beta fold hydrolase [Micromonosporaceae bacterium]|nr:alpha/beta fold hydrolase [Micromonosporaceae bacterium]